MTVKELYERMGGDYDAAVKIMMMDSMIAKFIVKVPDDPTYGRLMAAVETMDTAGIFEAAHTLKGVAANFGLTKLSTLASELTEEFRPGRERQMSDEEVREKLEAIRKLHEQTVEGIRAFTAG
ncbi:MAG: Hpt domain-containing protein [Clostridia bacterium]|nr:Hpt domain-containing protein [Clostridia bacterium]